MKSKYVKKDKRIKKSKTPKNSKKIVKAKKAARRLVPCGKYEYGSIALNPKDLGGVKSEAPVTLGFESSAAAPIEPEALADAAAEAHEPIPGDPTEAV